jgi:hypothetical protein
LRWIVFHPAERVQLNVVFHFRTQTINSEFRQIVDAYRDISVSGTNDPGGRVIEFMLRLVF